MATITLPNGLAVVGINRSETLFLYEEMFAGGYLRNGITVHDRDCVVDVGANIGLFLIYLQTVARDLRFVACEPIPEVCDALRENVAIFRLSADVFECALGRDEGTSSFTYYPDVTIMSGCYADPAEDASTMKAFILHGAPHLRSSRGVDVLVESRLRRREISCSRRTLSGILDEKGIERVDLLKIDVEKSEFDVLSGIRDAHWSRVRQVVIEVHDKEGRVAEVAALLRRHGMVVAVESGGGGAGAGIMMLFARREAVSTRDA